MATARPPHCYSYRAGLASGALETLRGVALLSWVSASRPAQLTSLPGDALPGALPLAATASLARPRGGMLHLPLKKNCSGPFLRLNPSATREREDCIEREVIV